MTLAELLIVVAIIAVLVAISIPIFSNQLEKAREAVDIANIRAAYAEIMTDALTDDTTSANTTYSSTDNSWSKTVDLKQKQDDWQTDITDITIGDHPLDAGVKGSGKATITVALDETTGEGTVTITYSAS